MQTTPLARQPPEPRQRRLLFIGDSITAGYGVLCNDSARPFAPETESALHAYAAVAARALEADAHVIAYSGKGDASSREGPCMVLPSVSALLCWTLAIVSCCCCLHEAVHSDQRSTS